MNSVPSIHHADLFWPPLHWPALKPRWPVLTTTSTVFGSYLLHLVFQAGFVSFSRKSAVFGQAKAGFEAPCNTAGPQMPVPGPVLRLWQQLSLLTSSVPYFLSQLLHIYLVGYWTAPASFSPFGLVSVPADPCLETLGSVLVQEDSFWFPGPGNARTYGPMLLGISKPSSDVSGFILTKHH